MSNRIVVISLLVISIVITGYFLGRIAVHGYWIWGDGKIQFEETGQVGDFIGGVVGTLISGAGFYFLYLTLNEQRKAINQQEKAVNEQKLAIREQKMSFERERFESKYLDLVKLHRDNVAEMRYQVWKGVELKEVYSREAIKEIFNEFIECLHEVKKFARVYKNIDILQPSYNVTLEEVKIKNKCKATTSELALIDISYCIVFFGLSEESDQVFLNLFWNRYEREFIKRLKKYLRLKPFLYNGETSAYSNWLNFSQADSVKIRDVFEPFYQSQESIDEWLGVENGLFANSKMECYYRGHQHRLGHYFRHLFQTFKFLSLQNILAPDEKYFFAKTLRAQLSTYEQLILFINSITSLGMKWEYTADVADIQMSSYDLNDFKFITRYNLIKNLPGSQYYEFKYRNFYPKVRYEYKEDISYL